MKRFFQLCATLVTTLMMMACAAPAQTMQPAGQCMPSTETPSPRGEMASAYDGARKRLWVFGGNTSAPQNCMPRTTVTNELWAYNTECQSWQQFAGDGPDARTRPAAAWDSRANRLLVFGGRMLVGANYRNFADIWAFDPATSTWTELSSSGGPTGRTSAVMTFDAARNRVLVFGGNTSTSSLAFVASGEMWAFDLGANTWSRINASGPSARLYHSSAASDTHWYVYAGTPTFDGPFLSDLWRFEFASDTWERLDAHGTAPESRFGAEAFWDAERDRLLIVAGHDGTDLGNRNDLWSYDVGGRMWSQLRGGDTLQGRPAGQCMFPPNFTMPDLDSPERRYAFARGQGSNFGVIFGGKTDCGNVNDVWRLHFDTGTWAPEKASAGGEACTRTGNLNCTTLCY